MLLQDQSGAFGQVFFDEETEIFGHIDAKAVAARRDLAFQSLRQAN